MPENTDISNFHQIELSIRRLESVCTMPCVASQLFSRLGSRDCTASDLSALINSDAALTAKILSIAYDEGINISEEDFSFEHVLEQLDSQVIYKGLLSVKVLSGSGCERDVVLPKQELARHNLAVACCAKIIAEKSNQQVNPELAYTAGLLHDIGKLAIEKLMPKSFARLVEEAKNKGVSICDIEFKYLGADHAAIGRKLAERWHLPESLVLAIWLHHSDTEVIGRNIKKARIASIVQLADCVVRSRDIGASGSYDKAELPTAVMSSLAIEQEQIEEIFEQLDTQVREKCRVLGMDLARPDSVYCDVVGEVAGQLAKERASLLEQRRQLQKQASHFVFVTEFISSIDSTDEAFDIAEKLAVSWQRFYQTGPLCLYLKNSKEEKSFNVVVAENQAEIKSVIIEGPADEDRAMWKLKENGTINAADSMDWLLEQVGIEFNLRAAKLVPLYCGSKHIGGILFELRCPADMELPEESIKSAATAAGGILGIALASGIHQGFAEQFVRLISRPETNREEAAGEEVKAKETKGNLLEALAEMAAGAAHELNNPLSVIAGRAQLLAQSETEEEKKKILYQIRENTKELASIIDGLMSFAEPAAAKAAATDLSQIVDEASELAALKSKVEKVDVQLKVADEADKVFVDSGQVVSAIANILVNCLEAYPDKSGVIEVNAERAGGFVKLSITDFGCGMDSETLSKAAYPFFSSKQAGRQRGMGLAYANRVIQLNKGRLETASEPDKGTTVTIYLPCE